MSQSLQTNHYKALQFLFTEDLYLINSKQEKHLEAQNLDDKKNKSIYFDYLGENNAYFLILLDEKDHTHIAPNKLETLLKIMHAKGLDLKDLAIVNYTNYPRVAFNDLKSFFACTRLALFGIDPQKIQLPSLPVNKAENIHGVKTMACYSLDEMETNQDKKRQFWSVMKSF